MSRPPLPAYPLHYRDRIAEIEEELAELQDEKNVLVLLGDSISEWHPAKRLREKRVVNMGIAGDQADHEEVGMLKRVGLVTKARPDEVFLLVGINDLANAKPPEQVARDQQKVIRALEAAVPEAMVYVQSVMPTSGDLAHLLPSIQRANKQLHEFVQETRYKFVDLTRAFSDAGTGQLLPELTTDGVHLSETGYKLWTSIIETAS